MVVCSNNKYHPEGYSKDSDVLINQARRLIKKGQKQITLVEKYFKQRQTRRDL